MTLSKSVLLCGALAAIALPAAARAEGAATTDQDARCLAMSLILAGSQDPNNQKVGSQGVIYYLGRVDARPRGDLETRLAAQFGQVTPQNANGYVQACMQAMAQRGQAFHLIAQHLQQRFGKAPPAGAAPQAAPSAPSGH
ncbi:MAG: hypothetical protein JO303_04345 [Caulobacteraceae bacterium]|nr:hypothetical protein [Caulobacteraceae bacterium]